MEKLSELYAGKAKTIYLTDDPDKLVVEFRDDTSMGDGERIEQFDRKGMVNNKFTAFIMDTLEAAGIETHHEALLSDTEALVKRLEMIPLECVVRNVATGSLCRRLGIEDGIDLNPPTFEFFLKNDALHDPMVNEYHALSFRWASREDMELMKTKTFEVNTVLSKLFADAGVILVDFKLEFGKQHGKLYLGDEFSPDGCRLWDADTRKKLDKDRFRQGLGGVIEAYEEVAHRLGIELD
jgi:phosphoribosylaminoimidazole-succinocarboxamide synthase